MNDFFSSLISTLDISSKEQHKISNDDYETFCKEFVFEKLKDKTFGEAFCERFDIDDVWLKKYSDETAKFHIEKLGYIK